MCSDKNNNQLGQIACSEIGYYKKIYENAKNKYECKHKLTRRLALVSIFWSILILLIIYSKSITNIDLNNYFVHYSYNVNFPVFIPIMILICEFIPFVLINTIKIEIKYIVIYEIILFVFYILSFSKESLSFLVIFNLVVFITSYAANRMFGYTRAWSRNRLAVQHLKLLKREYKLSIKGKSDMDIIIQKDNTLLKLSQLNERFIEAAYVDIMGDYLAVNNGALGWLRNLKK